MKKYIITLSTILSTSILAQNIDISDIPMVTKNKAKPAVLFILDDSGSMDFEVLFTSNDGALWYDAQNKRFWNSSGVLEFNSIGNVDSQWKKYVYLFPNGTSSDTKQLDDSQHHAIPPTPEFAFARSSDYNPLYYNSMINYAPWSPANNGSTTTAFSNANTNTPLSKPRGSTTFTISSDISSTLSRQSEWTFKYHQGMTIPTNAMYYNGSTWVTPSTPYTVPNGVSYNVAFQYYPATFYVKDPSGNDAIAPDGSKLKKYEIKSGNVFPSGRTYAAELQNFANWFQYYRKRKLMVAGSMGQTLPVLNSIRAGLIRFNSLPSASSVVYYDLDSSSDTTNEKRLLDVVYNAYASGGTPTKDALDFASKQFDRTDTGAPIKYACQINANFVITDGFANASTSFNKGNVDNTNTAPQNQWGAGTAPYADNYSNSLADIAMYYYSKKYRSDLEPNLTSCSVPTSIQDQNRCLHVNTYALGLGAKGTIFSVDSQKTNDPYTYTPTWPDAGNRDRNVTSVDDLWHATINGRGLMLNSADPVGGAQNMSKVLSNVIAKNSSASAVAVSNFAITTTDNKMYSTSFNSSGWTGDLKAFSLNTTDGSIQSQLWSARDMLDNKNWTTRKIVVNTSTGAKPFSLSNLDSAHQTALLNSTDLINYIKGDRSNEGSTFRSRISILGDLISSEPVLQNNTGFNYSDSGYSSFATSIASRKKVIYVGSNDGMLHAFDANTGEELWAYIPKAVVPSLENYTNKSTFTHKYRVDGNIAIGDVFFDGQWHTILVFGLNKGGYSYSAIDITNPDFQSETDLANAVLWEITTPNMGYTYGIPTITKTKNNWVVLLGNGLNPLGDGKGHLYSVNPKDGTIVSDIPTNISAGITYFSAYNEESDYDVYTKSVYAGDTYGNLWKFNMDTDTVSLITTLKDSAGNQQPITTQPELVELFDQTVVIVGTGLYLGDSDIPGNIPTNTYTTQTQSIYAIKDTGTPFSLVRSGASQNVYPLSYTVNSGLRIAGTNVMDWDAYRGWFIDLTAGTGERLITHPQVIGEYLLFTTNQPSNVGGCILGGTSFSWQIHYKTGSVTTVNGQNVLGQPTTNTSVLSSRPTIVKLPSNKLVQYINTSDGNTVKSDITGSIKQTFHHKTRYNYIQND